MIFSKSTLTREDPEPGNSKEPETLWTCRGPPPDYNAISFAAQIHSKGVKLTPENSAIFRFYFVTRNL